MLETTYQRKLMRTIKDLLPGCEVFKNDPHQIQGLPDLLILFEDRWAMLEVKISEGAPKEPNQDYYVDKFQGMSFASFIYPEIEEEVLSELQHSLRTPREARIS